MLISACVTEPPIVMSAPTTEVIEDDVAIQKLAMIICVNQRTFKKAVRKERLKFYGVIPTIEKIILEIYTAQPGESGFTIAIRDAERDEVCIVASGSELVPVIWSGRIAHSE